MRKDERGNPCPGTLGEYRDLCAKLDELLGEASEATAFLDRKIAKNGRDDVVLADDWEMRALLMPLLVAKAGEEPGGAHHDAR